MFKNGFGMKLPTKVGMPLNPNKQTNKPPREEAQWAKREWRERNFFKF